MLIFTGSKFFGGPPFSGSVFLDKSLEEDIESLDPLKINTLGNFFCSGQISEAMSTLKESFPDWINLGLMLRWSVAIRHIENYFLIPKKRRNEIIEIWENTFREGLKDLDFIDLLDEKSQDIFENSVAGKNTILSFYLKSPFDHSPLSLEKLKCVYMGLKQNSPKIHLGQPVVFCKKGKSVLRVALSAPLLCAAHEKKSERSTSLSTPYLDSSSTSDYREIFQKDLNLLIGQLKKAITHLA